MTKLHIRARGDGPPLVCLHGGMGLDHTIFLPWFDAFADERRLILFDFTGNGRSRPDATEDEMSITRWAEDVEAVREQTGSETIALLGHSFGGLIALDYALRYPDRISALVLSNTAPVVDFAEAIVENANARGTPDQIEAVMRVLTTSATEDAGLDEAFAQILPLYFHTWDADAGTMLRQDTVYRHAAFNVGNAREMPAFDVRDRLSEIQMPTLVLSSSDDWIMPEEHGGRRLAQGIPSARHHVFTRSGHFPYVEEPESFVQVVLRFLRESGA